MIWSDKEVDFVVEQQEMIGKQWATIASLLAAEMVGRKTARQNSRLMLTVVCRYIFVCMSSAVVLERLGCDPRKLTIYGTDRGFCRS